MPQCGKGVQESCPEQVRANFCTDIGDWCHGTTDGASLEKLLKELGKVCRGQMLERTVTSIGSKTDKIFTYVLESFEMPEFEAVAEELGSTVFFVICPDAAGVCSFVPVSVESRLIIVQ